MKSVSKVTNFIVSRESEFFADNMGFIVEEKMKNNSETYSLFKNQIEAYEAFDEYEADEEFQERINMVALRMLSSHADSIVRNAKWSQVNGDKFDYNSILFTRKDNVTYLPDLFCEEIVSSYTEMLLKSVSYYTADIDSEDEKLSVLVELFSELSNLYQFESWRYEDTMVVKFAPESKATPRWESAA